MMKIQLKTFSKKLKRNFRIKSLLMIKFNNNKNKYKINRLLIMTR